MNNRNLIVYIGFAVILIAIIYFFSNPGIKDDPNAPKPPAGYTIPQGAIHWHSRLKIIINGEEQLIPDNVGLGAGAIDTTIGSDMGAAPIHAHGGEDEYNNESGRKLHMESLAPKSKIRTLTLGYFFQVWGNRFNSTCILHKCNSPDGTLTMTVNGKPNTDYENFFMRDGDRIVITFD